jgi:hypothetical protein
MQPHTFRSFFTLKRTRWLVSALTIFATLALLIGTATPARALDTSVFELDGNAVTDHTGTGTPDDWDRVCFSVQGTGCTTTTPANTSVVEFKSQGATSGTTFTGGGSKDPLDISSWAWNQGTGGLPGKDILLNGFTAQYTSAGTTNCPGSSATVDCKQLFFGMDRFDNSGDAQNGFWFFQNPISLGTGKSGGGMSFNGVHKNGDILVVSDFSIGGSISTIFVFVWNSSVSGNLQLLNSSTSANCANPTALAGAFCGIVNPSNGTTAPWSFTDKSGNTSFQNGEFYEGGLDLNAFGLNNECFASTLAESRSSTSTSATLKSFVLGSLPGCTPMVVTHPQDANGNDITQQSIQIPTSGTFMVKDQATASVTGATTWTGNVAFFLCGPADLASQPSCLSGGTSIGSVAVSNTTPTVTSPLATITSAAPAAGAAPFNYCWRGEFTVSSPSGLQPPPPDGSTTECFTITPVTPTLTTKATIVGTPATTTNVPATITDTANLSGTANEPGSPVINPTTAGGPAKGTITFTAFGPNSCTTVAFTTTASVNGDGAYPVSFIANLPGTYTFEASYTGDAPNTNAAADSVCSFPNSQTNGEAVTATDTSSASSAQNWLPNDTATVASGSGKPTLNGTLTLQLYDGSANCTTGAVSGQLYTQTVSNASTATISSTNTTFKVSASDSVSWLVTFTSSDPNVAGSTHCENTSLTVTN